jgi:hypothetical protein
MKTWMFALTIVLFGAACGGMESEDGYDDGQPTDVEAESELTVRRPGNTELPDCWFTPTTPGTCYPSVNQCQSCCSNGQCKFPTATFH